MITASPNSWKTWAQSFPNKAPEGTAYKSPFRVVAKGSEKEAAEVLIYDQIGRDFWSGEGMAANDFAEILKDIHPMAELVIGINSPGGNVWDGLSIFNQLSARKGKVITRNDGMAASIASVILQAGTERQSHSAALVMVHKAWGMMVGNADDAEQFKQDLMKHDQVLAEVYSSKTGKTMKEIEKVMSEETFFTGSEAKDFGLVDTVIGKNNLSASAVKPGSQTAAAGKTQTIRNQMTEPTPTAPAASTPVLNLDPVIAAINALGDKLPKAPLPGTEPVTTPRVENLGSPAVEKFKRLEHGAAKANFIRANYGTLRKELPGAGIYAANTIDSGLANSILSSDAIDTMRTYIAPIAAFSRKIEPNPISKRQVINVPLISSVGSIQTNPTNFETGDTVAADVAVTVNQYSKSWSVSNPEGNLGLSLSQFSRTNAMVMAEGLFALVSAKFTTGNFGSGTTIGAAANFDSADLAPILALGKNYKRVQLLLDGGHLAYLLPTTRENFVFGEPGAYGFDGGIYKNNLWTGATANTVGFVCGPDAIAVASGAPANLPSGEFITQETADIGAGLSVTVSTWFSRSTRAFWGSYDIMFGVAVGDATQGEILVTS